MKHINTLLYQSKYQTTIFILMLEHASFDLIRFDLEHRIRGTPYLMSNICEIRKRFDPRPKTHLENVRNIETKENFPSLMR